MLQFSINQDELRNKLETKTNFLKEEIQIRCDSLANEIDVIAREFYKEIESYKLNGKNLKTELSNRNIDFTFIGKVCRERTFELFKTSSSKNVQISGKGIYRMSHLKNTNQIAVTDWEDYSLKIFDLNGQLFKRIDLVQIFTGPGPRVICSNNNHIYLATNGPGISFFDEKFNYIGKTALEVYLLCPFYLLFDDSSQDFYISDDSHELVLKWNVLNKTSFQSKKLSKPNFMRCIQNYLFVTSGTDWDTDKEIVTQYDIFEGLNCIYVLDKNNLDILNEIKRDDWLGPNGLEVDSNKNLLTTAFELNNEKRVSQNRFLFVLNIDGECLNKVKLGFDNLMWIHDMFLLETKLFILSKGDDFSLDIVEFC